MFSLKPTKRSFSLERNFRSEFCSDNITDFTEVDTIVNDEQLSLVETGGWCESGWCLLKSLEYTDVRGLKLDQRQLWMCFMHYICEFGYKFLGDGEIYPFCHRE